jgi:DNA repair protein RadC
VRVTETPTPEAVQPSRFFARLADWRETPRAVEVFQRVVNRPIATPQPLLYAQLYRHLVDHLLRRLRLPRSEGAEQWEWKPLYEFGERVDPFYFTEAAIQDLLGHWPEIGYENRQVMVSVLSGFFHLRRAGFPACYPSPLMPAHEVERWARIFPPEWAWESLGVLHRLGFATLASRPGYRAFLRFSEGRFEAELDAGSLRRWMAECWRAGAPSPGVGPEQAQPYHADFVAAAFGGRVGAMGVEGPCGYIPDCATCPLADECRWFNAPAGERPGPSEVLALVRRGHVEHLRSDQLLQALFNLRDGDEERLRRGLAGLPLRRLAALSMQELETLFGFQRPLPAQLVVAFELCRRFNEERMEVGGAFQTPWDVFKHFRMRLRDLKQEQFIVVLLDNKKRYLSDLVITQGTLNTSPVHPREVFNAAIRERAASVVVVHNHPSGDPHPSREDIHVTQQLIKVGELVGIPVLDHIIIADDVYLSMLEQGLLKG